MSKAQNVWSKTAKKVETKDVVTGVGSGVAVGAVTQHLDKPKHLLADGAYKGKKLVYYNPYMKKYPFTLRKGDKLRGAKHTANKALTLINTKVHQLRHPSIPIYTDPKKIPKGSAVYNYSEFDLQSGMKKRRVKPGVSVINNIKDSTVFTDKYKLQSSKAFYSRGVSTKTELLSDYITRKTGKSIANVSKLEAQKVFEGASHKFIKPRMGTLSRGIYVAGDKILTEFDETLGKGTGKKKSGQPAFDTLWDNVQKVSKDPKNTFEKYIVQDKLDFAGKKEFRIHVGPEGVQTTGFKRWGSRSPVKIDKHVDKEFLSSLGSAHKEYLKTQGESKRGMVIGYDVAQTKKGWKVVEGNIMSDFLAGGHWRAKNLKFKHAVTGKGLTGKALGAGALTAAAVTAYSALKKEAAKKKKWSKDTKAEAGLAGTTVGAGAYIKMRMPDYHPSRNVAALQRESRGKVTSVHYGTSSKVHNLVNKAVFGGSMKHLDIRKYHRGKKPSDKNYIRKGPWGPKKKEIPGTLYVRAYRGSANKWVPDVGMSLGHKSSRWANMLSKDKLSDKEAFKGLAVENWDVDRFLESKGTNRKEFLSKTNDEWETMFKKWHKEKPVFVKQDSSNMKGIYGDLDKIRYQGLQDIKGEKVYVKSSGDNYDILRKQLTNPKKAKGINKGTFFFGTKIPKGMKEYRVHMIDGKFVNASPRWGKGALLKWETNPDKVGKDSVRKLEGAMSKYQYEDLPAELKKHREHKKYKTTPARMRHKYTGMDVFIDPAGKHAPKIVEINSSPMTAGMPMTNLRSDQVEDILREKGRIKGVMPGSKSKEYKKLVRQPKNLMILTKARLDKMKAQYSEAKAFHRSLTGRKELRNVAVAKAGVIGLGAVGLTGAAIHGFKERKKKR